jgi:hypothetical protein
MVIKRPRVKHEKTFEERLAAEAGHFRELADKTPPGVKREFYLRRARQAETASHINAWLRSPGLRPPKDIREGSLGTLVTQAARHRPV